MKRILLVPIVVAMLASIGNAAPVCTQAGLDYYLANYMAGCTIGDKLFSNWAYVPATGTASDVTVVPLPDDPLLPAIKFTTGAWQAFAGQTRDYFLSYTVAAPPGMLIDDADLEVTGGVSGSGSGSVTEHLNNPVTDIPGSPLVAGVPSPPNPQNAHSDFSPVQSLNVVNQIHLQGGDFPSHPSISIIIEDFSQIQSVPEPVGTLLIGFGILVFGLKLRKRSGQ